MKETIAGNPNIERRENYYDSLYQLVATDYTDLQKLYEWSYDDIGNRLYQKITNYSNEPPSITQENYSYYTFSPNTNYFYYIALALFFRR